MFANCACIDINLANIYQHHEPNECPHLHTQYTYRLGSLLMSRLSVRRCLTAETILWHVFVNNRGMGPLTHHSHPSALEILQFCVTKFISVTEQSRLQVRLKQQ